MTHAIVKPTIASPESLSAASPLRRWLVAAASSVLVVSILLGSMNQLYANHAALPVQAQVEAQELATPALDGIRDDVWAPLRLPNKLCRADCESRFKVYRAKVELTDDAAIYLPMFDGSAAVYLNGHTIGQSGSMVDPIADMTYQPTYFELPRDLQTDGPNRLDIIVSSLVPAGGRLMPFHIGSAAALEVRHARMSFLTVDSLAVVNGIFVVLGFCALLLYASGDRDRLYLWFTLLIAFAAMRNLNVLWPEWPTLIAARNWIYLTSTLGVLLTTGALVSRFAAQHETKIDILLILLIIPASLLIAFDLQSDIWSSWMRVNLYIRVIGLVLVPLVLARFLLHARKLPIVVHAAIFALLAAGLVLVLHDIVLSWPPRRLVFQLSNLAALPVVLSFCVTLVSRYANHLETIKAHNVELRAAVAEREQELADSHARETRQARRDTLNEERQRIMRDMHDGVAGRLAVMIQKLRHAGDASMTVALQQSLTDLRLAIDSLDDDPDLGLAMAIDMFRDDVRSTLENSGVEFNWRVHVEGEPTLGPEKMLHLYRCLQESITNVIRHSGATRAEIQVDGTSRGVAISVTDNGAGFDESTANGRGLVNIRRRLDAIGGEVSITSGATGTIVDMALPADDPHIHGGVETET